MNRRDFGKFTGFGALALAASSTLLATGCSDVFEGIKNWVPVGLNAFSGILNVLVGAGVIVLSPNTAIYMVVNDIKAGFAQLLIDVQAYIDAPAAQKSSLLNKIITAMGIIVGSFQDFLGSIKIDDPKVLALVVGLSEIILSTIAGFQSQLPVAATLVKSPVRIGATFVSFTPKGRTIRQFKKDYNTVATANGHSEIELKVSLFERL